MSLDHHPSADPQLPDPTSPSRPQFQRSSTSPWPPRSPSTDSLPYMTSWASPNLAAAPVLKKRHSTYTLSHPERPASPAPAIPPQRPPRNPARTGSTFFDVPSQRPPTKLRSRPSTATSATSSHSREDVTPWEFQSSPAGEKEKEMEKERSPRRSAPPSVKSRASSTGFVLTGTVEDVTPWDLEPPPVPKLPRRTSETQFSKASHKATGPVEEVAPWELFPAVVPEPIPDTPLASQTSHSHSHTRTTGPTEEVTPWELYPVLDTTSNTDRNVAVDGVLPSTRPRSSITMSKTQVEEVTPWELYPVPVPEASNSSSQQDATITKKSSRSNRPTSSSGSHKGLSDLGIVRRRRSIGNKPGSSPPKTRSQVHTSSMYPLNQPISSTSSSSHDRDHPPSVKSHHQQNQHQYQNYNPLPHAETSSSARTSPTTSRFSLKTGLSSYAHTTHTHASTSASTSKADTASTASSTSPSSHSRHQVNGNLKFSTADRTILEELKRNISAKEAQFVIKGAGNTTTGGGLSVGKKYHPYSSEEVPYPRSYDREVVDLDVWETIFCQNIADSLTWHVFDPPPVKVLDLGCGTGTWILNAAQTWKESSFVGLDIVPLHPDLTQVGSPDLAGRITWIQANFLDDLPFQNEEFDFVHIKRVSLGVPEDKWDHFFEEIIRVMKPGGAFEMIEEDLFFPGQSTDDEDSGDESGSEAPLSRRNSVSSNSHISKDRRHSRDGDEAIHSEFSRISEESSPVTPTTAYSTYPPTPSNPTSPVDDKIVEEPEQELAAANEQNLSVYVPPLPSPPQDSPMSGYVTLIPPHSRSSARPMLHVKTGSSPHGRAFTNKFAGSAVSLLGTMGYSVPPSNSISDLPSDVKVQQKRRSSSVLAPISALSEDPHSQHVPSPQPSAHESHNPLENSNVAPFLLRSLPKAPTNPRDHSLLKAIYLETLASRFINRSPLSILTTTLEWHFKDVRTHPPLVFSFPPTFAKPLEDEGEEPDNLSRASSPDPYDSDDARDAIIPIATRPQSTKSGKSNTSGALSSHTTNSDEITEQTRWLSMRGLLERTSPFITLDDARGYGYVPVAKGSLPASKTKDGKQVTVRKPSRLPNKTLNIDLRSLNLHLALRTKEILACSESMWEWVKDYQSQLRTRKAGRTRSGSLEVPAHLSQSSFQSGASASSLDLNKNQIADMTRDEFDILLGHFEMDMHDQVALGSAIQDRFSWPAVASAESLDRKAFDTACERWDKWAKEQNSKLASHPYRQSHSNHYQPRNSVSTSSMAYVTPDKPSSKHDSVSRSRSGSQTASGLHVNGEASATGHSPVHSSRPASSVHFTSTASPQPPSHPSIPPSASRKISRAMRVFVAWKENSPSS
ncbi:hypothetical protein BDQ12DRAFT_721473 [Crucibulum laeve]|uniref:Methyltransferase domain-containing protein n=1 Tax=Crucibulum laeve TaxID=68775 RepID=A0A5C3M699_9AGAR|nr:hypothetical protein BDQ12DRAFT_721473 [Crucibulum laeve]